MCRYWLSMSQGMLTNIPNCVFFYFGIFAKTFQVARNLFIRI